MTVEQLKAKSNAILDKLEEDGFDLDDWSIEDAHNNGFIDGYHECQKEHEWHYVKDGDLPKKSKEYVVKVKEYGGISVYIGRYWKKEKMFTGSYLKELDVIKWKEIE